MHDLVGAYERVERLYRLYIKSAFPLRSRLLSEERDQLLSRDEVLSQAPLLETVPVYQSAGLNLEAATRELPPEYGGLAALGQKLFPPSQELYQHQWQSLLSATAKQEDLVVTTGTGSGKTECFLLPLFAQLARESATWSRPDISPANRYWWRDENEDRQTGRILQWSHVTRPRAIRAIILYPLNALVEDQMRRLRMALDDNEVHTWLDKHRFGNRLSLIHI